MPVWIGPEDDTDEQLGHEQHDEGHRDEPGAGHRRGTVRVRQPGRGVQGERAPEDEQDARRHDERELGAGHDDDQAEQGRAEHERGLVGRSLVGERGLHQVRLVVLLLAGDRAPAHPCQRADLRHRGAGHGSHRDDERGVDPGLGEGDEGEQAEAAEQGLHEHHRPLADPVGEAARDGRADGVRHGERAGGGTARAVRAGGAGDEEEGAHLGHGQREPADEGDGDVEGSGEGEQPPVGGEGGHRVLPGSAPG